jgi:dCMP deaminase
MTDWNNRFLGLAAHVAGWSKDPSTQVGAVIADSLNRIVSLGFNGFPRGIEDDERLMDRAAKYAHIIHAEINAMLFARMDLTGTSLYTWPFPPCSRCAPVIIQAGITRVFWPGSWFGEMPDLFERWKSDVAMAQSMFSEAGVTAKGLDN